MIAVSNNGRALEFVSDKMKNDKEIVLKAVEQARFCYILSFASDELKDDAVFLNSILDLCPESIIHISERLNNDLDFLEKLVIKYPNLMRYTPTNFQEYYKFVQMLNNENTTITPTSTTQQQREIIDPGAFEDMTSYHDEMNEIFNSFF